MRTRVVAARRGAEWFVEGWRLFRVSPPMWVALVFTYWLVMSAISLIPVVGIAAATILIPGISVGFMSASQSCERGQIPAIGLLFAGFRQHPEAQLKLGALYLGGLLLVLMATTLVDHGALAHWMVAGKRPSEQTLQSGAFSTSLILAAVLYLPLMMMFWFAPVLAAWHNMTTAKALFFSIAASLMNWRAFLVYGAVAGLLTVALPFVLLSVLSAIFGNDGLPLSAFVFVLLLILMPTLFASFYASYRDVFEAASET